MILLPPRPSFWIFFLCWGEAFGIWKCFQLWFHVRRGKELCRVYFPLRLKANATSSQLPVGFFMEMFYFFPFEKQTHMRCNKLEKGGEKDQETFRANCLRPTVKGLVVGIGNLIKIILNASALCCTPRGDRSSALDRSFPYAFLTNWVTPGVFQSRCSCSVPLAKGLLELSDVGVPLGNASLAFNLVAPTRVWVNCIS